MAFWLCTILVYWQFSFEDVIWISFVCYDVYAAVREMEDQEGEEVDSTGVGRHRWVSQAVYHDDADEWRLPPLVQGKELYFVTDYSTPL